VASHDWLSRGFPWSVGSSSVNVHHSRMLIGKLNFTSISSFLSLKCKIWRFPLYNVMRIFCKVSKYYSWSDADGIINGFSKNRDLTLEEFKRIWWMEYGHRTWGRLIGAVFYIPAAVFWYRGWLTPVMKTRTLVMGTLLAFQVGTYFEIL